MSMTIRSRLAPTPSGYLHIGNAVNFLITWLLVRTADGLLRLRIDDADGIRSRPEFVEDIFAQLDWLGISWDEGPNGPDDFYRRHSQLLKNERYRGLLGELGGRAHLFACGCSRREIGGRLYPGTCRASRHAPLQGQAVRVHVPEPTEMRVNGTVVLLCRTMGDFVLWRKEGQPSYQLASLADDLDARINLIVRGEDLLESTAAQLFLAERIGAEGFLNASFHHHGLVTGETGGKLSKSDNALSLKAMRERGIGREEVYRSAARLLGVHGVVGSLDELLAACRKAPALERLRQP